MLSRILEDVERERYRRNSARAAGGGGGGGGGGGEGVRDADKYNGREISIR